jgi:hypothetical protein
MYIMYVVCMTLYAACVMATMARGEAHDKACEEALARRYIPQLLEIMHVCMLFHSGASQPCNA